MSKLILINNRYYMTLNGYCDLTLISESSARKRCKQFNTSYNVDDPKIDDKTILKLDKSSINLPIVRGCQSVTLIPSILVLCFLARDDVDLFVDFVSEDYRKNEKWKTIN